MKFPFRKQNTPYVPEGIQVFGTDQPKPNNRRWLWLGIGLVIAVVVIAAGLALGRYWSTRDDNNDQQQLTESREMVNQSPQDSEVPAKPGDSPVAIPGELNQASPETN